MTVNTGCLVTFSFSMTTKVCLQICIQLFGIRLWVALVSYLMDKVRQTIFLGKSAWFCLQPGACPFFCVCAPVCYFRELYSMTFNLHFPKLNICNLIIWKEWELTPKTYTIRLLQILIFCHKTTPHTKIVLRDLDLLFQGQTFKMLSFSETVWASTKECYNIQLVHLDICHRMTPLRSSTRSSF